MKQIGMLLHKPPMKKRATIRSNTTAPLDSSLTSIEWLPIMQIGENSLSTAMLPNQPSIGNLPSLPTTVSIPQIQEKLEPRDVDVSMPIVHSKPPYSYVALIRQAIHSSKLQRMTLNEIYQWIIDAYPYFRTAPAKWKVRRRSSPASSSSGSSFQNSIRHNLSLNKCFKRLQRNTNDPGKVGSIETVSVRLDCCSRVPIGQWLNSIAVRHSRHHLANEK